MDHARTKGEEATERRGVASSWRSTARRRFVPPAGGAPPGAIA